MKILKAEIEKRLVAARMPETLEEINKRQHDRGYKPPKNNIRDLGPMVCTYAVGASDKNKPSAQRCELEVRSNYKPINRWENLKGQERYALNK